ILPDEICGVQFGSGEATLRYKLRNRRDNLRKQHRAMLAAAAICENRNTNDDPTASTISPAHFSEESRDRMEDCRSSMYKENLPSLNDMTATFRLRQEEIRTLPIHTIVETWPHLFTVPLFRKEFFLLTSKNSEALFLPAKVEKLLGFLTTFKDNTIRGIISDLRSGDTPKRPYFAAIEGAMIALKESSKNLVITVPVSNCSSLYGRQQMITQGCRMNSLD